MKLPIEGNYSQSICKEDACKMFITLAPDLCNTTGLQYKKVQPTVGPAIFTYTIKKTTLNA